MFVQPPLWECYQQKLKEWELAMINLHYPSNEFQEKTTTTAENPPEKPPMFAFCLKPRGLEANKGSKQRSHKKLMYTSHHSSFSREQDLFHASGTHSPYNFFYFFFFTCSHFLSIFFFCFYEYREKVKHVFTRR